MKVGLLQVMNLIVLMVLIDLIGLTDLTQDNHNLMAFKNEVINNGIVVYADSALYSKDSVLKCLYWYGDNFRTSVTLEKDRFFKISLELKEENKFSYSELKNKLFKLENDLVDFNLRDIVTKETQNIRDLLTAKAFSNGEFDEAPPGELSDPVGFNVNDLKND